jgi:hypothetical protein
VKKPDAGEPEGMPFTVAHSAHCSLSFNAAAAAINAVSTKPCSPCLAVLLVLFVAPPPSVVKKPDAGEREGMPLTVANMCYERQLIARPADPGAPLAALLAGRLQCISLPAHCMPCCWRPTCTLG